jgi:hypothetical protein
MGSNNQINLDCGSIEESKNVSYFDDDADKQEIDLEM